jgi:hypothetical protein
MNPALIAVIPKIPGARLSTQCRGIALQDSILKIIDLLFTYRLTALIKETGLLDPHQQGFIPTSRCSKAQQHWKYAMETSKSNRKKTRLLGILLDITKAFDSVNWRNLVEAMLDLGLSLEVCKLVLNNLRSGRYQVQVNGATSGIITPTRGTPQGMPSSCVIFNFLMDRFWRGISALEETEHGELPFEVQWKHPPIKNWCDLLLCKSLGVGVADDVSLFHTDEKILTLAASWTAHCLAFLDLQINGAKTISFAQENPQAPPWDPEERNKVINLLQMTEQAPQKQAKLLGTTVDVNASIAEMWNRTIAKVGKAVGYARWLASVRCPNATATAAALQSRAASLAVYFLTTTNIKRSVLKRWSTDMRKTMARPH